jgi:ABC-type polysaccharide/polyol phosphate transport system ATPase subunit
MFYSRVIEARDITKIYKLYDRPLDRLKELLLHRPYHKDFVALDGITFSVERGETFGIVGDNGAGKSTLLKILSKTLSPTRGKSEIKGIVSSLLELGAGFHPEFTGIENIYLYGSLLGIDSERMKKKVDEIIAFSELGDFIHYPIKTYSSGMHVRLAFSVATAVDPDIMIIDEALSVGDQYFQKKCLDRMAAFKKTDKTIIFCSHDLYQVKTFCEKAIWLHHGRIKMMGDSAGVVNAYSGYEQMKAGATRTEDEPTVYDGVLKSSFLFIKDLSVRQNGRKDLTIECAVESLEEFHGHVGWAILRPDRVQVSCMTTHMQGKEPVSFRNTRNLRIEISDLNIVNGDYIVYVGIFDREAYRPIAVENTGCTLNTGIEVYNSVCYLHSAFIVE